MSAVKMIVHSYTSKTDSNGNRYTFSILTITRTAERIYYHEGFGGPGNAEYAALHVAGCYPSCYSVTEEIPIRKWEALKKMHENGMLVQPRTDEELEAELTKALKRRKPLKAKA